MERKKACLLISCLVLACFLSSILFQGSIKRTTEGMVKNLDSRNLVLNPSGIPVFDLVQIGGGPFIPGGSATINIHYYNIENNDMTFINIYAIGTGTINITVSKGRSIPVVNYTSLTVNWIIPSNISAGNYYIEVQDGNLPSVFATSNTITISPTPPPQWWTDYWPFIVIIIPAIVLSITIPLGVRASKKRKQGL